jgi:hypothetical protein
LAKLGDVLLGWSYRREPAMPEWIPSCGWPASGHASLPAIGSGQNWWSVGLSPFCDLYY